MAKKMQSASYGDTVVVPDSSEAAYLARGWTTLATVNTPPTYPSTIAGAFRADGGVFDGPNRVYSDSNPPQTLEHAESSTLGNPPTAATPVGGFTSTVAAVATFIRRLGMRRMTSEIMQDGSTWTAQPHLGLTSVGWFKFAPNTATGQAQFPVSITQTTASTAVVPALGSTFGLAVRGRFTTAATINTQNGPRESTARLVRSSIARRGGFHIVATWGVSTSVAASRGFCGVAAGIPTIGTSDPSASVNIAGIGWDSADGNLFAMTNDGSGTATKTSLGASFPNRTSGVDLYEMALYCPPGIATSIGWSVTRLNTGDYAEGTFTTDLPSADTLLSFQIAIGNGSTLSAASIDVAQLYIETPLHYGL